MEKVWLKSYPRKVSIEIDVNKYSSIGDLFEVSCRKFGQRKAFINMATDLTFEELDHLSANFASFLQHYAGLKKGDRVAIQMPNLLQYPVALYGALRAGLVVVNTNPLYTSREMRHQYVDSGAKAIVILANCASKLEEILAETDIETVIVTEVGDMLNFPKSFLVNFAVKHIKKMVPPYQLEKAFTFQEALELGAIKPFKAISCEHHDLAFLQYTGGTTGVSKGAMLTHKNIIANQLQILEWMKPLLKEGAEFAVCALPLYHIFSLTVNCFSFFAFGATNLMITNPQDVKAFLKTLKSYKFTLFVGLNTLFNAILNHRHFPTVNWESLKISVAGGMTLQNTVAEKWKRMTNSQIVEGYGLTESSPVASCNPVDGTDKVGTIGLPIPSTSMSLRNEANVDVARDQSGEICIKGPQVMLGYWKNPSETSKMITQDGWLRTGDIGTVDSDGFFKIIDRKKDMILVSGFNVYPNEIEEVVASHPKVLEVAAIGIPDDKSTEAVKIFIVCKDASLTKEEILNFCRQQLTGYKIPKHVEFRTTLPKTNVGKILRRALRDEELLKRSQE